MSTCPFCSQTDVKCGAALAVVDGHYGEWGPWSACSHSCEGGTQSRYRACDAPAPSEGGRDCQGAPQQERMCNLDVCPGQYQRHLANN